MDRRWLVIFLVLLVVGLYFFRPRRQTSPERAALQAITSASPWKPAPTAKPVNEGSSGNGTPVMNFPAKRKIMTKEERAQWAAGVQTQMKISLAATYGAQKSFFSEYHRYSTDYNSLGYFPEEKEIGFKVGFIRAYNPPGKPTSPTEGSSHPVLTLDDLDQYQQEQARANGQEPKPFNFGPSAKGVKIEDAAQYCQYECTASETGFEAIAVANLDDDPDLDVWIINDKKVMVHVHDDLAN